MKSYTVLLPIDVNGRIYQHGQTVELDDKTAILYKHALISQISQPEGETVVRDNSNS